MTVSWNCTLLPPVERQPPPFCLHSASLDWCLVLTTFEQRVSLTKETENMISSLFKNTFWPQVLFIENIET